MQRKPLTDINIHYDKNPPERRIEGTYLNIIKLYMTIPQQTLSSTVKKGKHFPSSQEQDKGAHSQHYYST